MFVIQTVPIAGDEKNVMILAQLIVRKESEATVKRSLQALTKLPAIAGDRWVLDYSEESKVRSDD